MNSPSGTQNNLLQIPTKTLQLQHINSNSSGGGNGTGQNNLIKGNGGIIDIEESQLTPG